MKKLILTAFMLAMAAGGIDANTQRTTEADATMVYICTGKSSKRYHKTDECRGLDNCQGDIKLVTLEKARQLGRTECRLCYKKHSIHI